MDMPILFYDIREVYKRRRRHRAIVILLLVVALLNMVLTGATIYGYGCMSHEIACPVTGISMALGIGVILSCIFRLLKLRRFLHSPWYSKSLILTTMFYSVVEVIRAAVIFPIYYTLSQYEWVIFLFQTGLAILGSLSFLIATIVTIVALVCDRRRIKYTPLSGDM